MRIVFLALMMLSAAWATAQGYPSQKTQTSQTADSGSRMVQGCLSQSNGNYTLTDRDGNSYVLTGEPSKLSEHIAHEVQITGRATLVPQSPGASVGGTTGTVVGPKGSSTPAINVMSVKHISETCEKTSSR